MRRATILGGPRDGEILDVVGPFFREPIPPQRYRFIPAGEVPEMMLIRERIYELRQDWDGQYFYVMRP